MTRPGQPRNAWREEPWWHWDWPGRPKGYLTPGNGVQALSGPDGDHGPPVARIFVPSAEHASGFYDHWVYRDPPAPPSPRKLGL